MKTYEYDQKSSEEISRDIEHTQARIDAKLSAAREQFTLRGLVNLAFDKLQGGSGETDRVDEVRQKLRSGKAALQRNPTATSMVGLGGILALASSLFENFNLEKSCSKGLAASREKFGSLRDRIQSLSSQASDSVGQKASLTKDRLSSGSETLSEKATEAGQLSKENPLMVGLGLFAAGIAISALAPRTKTEDEILGAHSDRLREKASEKSAELLSQGRQKVSDQLEDQGLSS